MLRRACCCTALFLWRRVRADRTLQSRRAPRDKARLSKHRGLRNDRSRDAEWDGFAKRLLSSFFGTAPVRPFLMGGWRLAAAAEQGGCFALCAAPSSAPICSACRSAVHSAGNNHAFTVIMPKGRQILQARQYIFYKGEERMRGGGESCGFFPALARKNIEDMRQMRYDQERIYLRANGAVSS